ncbi:molybdopterin-dependent oxidoreductase [Shewanella pneumatophori]|uniref:Molybdopterin-dependent oxidoreductase n=1 Tax=Shewanella pneumatophori TaxID=314092 RepID=A0A9X1ZFY0_9GAMM|nr:molybdopterin-dependent oxidoreductase [Shewanella pneumatophori]MCL1137023.1 molybdopterin-dependent oxidoreductase [Shewanella pneumatophori]
MPSCKTTCAYCGVGCGIEISRGISEEKNFKASITQSDNAFKKVSVSRSREGNLKHIDLYGDAIHPANFGELCAKGMSLLEGTKVPNKLLYPRLNRRQNHCDSDKDETETVKVNASKTIIWDEAIDKIASKFNSIIAKHGPDSIAFYLSGQLLTEDYYVANKLAKGFLGCANIDTNSRLCMSSAVTAHTRAFGEDVVPGCYQDFELADVIVLVGANTAWTHPVLFKRILAAREQKGTKLVVVDPRKTATASYADLHLQLQPGSDLALFNGLLSAISHSSRKNPFYIQNNTQGFEEAIQAVNSCHSLEKVAVKTGLTVKDISWFYQLYTATAPLVSAANKVVTASGQGVNQSLIGTDTYNAIINCHLAMGDIGQPGCGPFSLTGQPNAMGGREVGGMATQLAAHMGFTLQERNLLSEYWQTESVVKSKGLTATEIFSQMASGEIKAIWIMGTNPLVSLPDTSLVKRGLKRCEFVVVSDITADTDTAKYADLLLPAQGWSEKSGTVTNSERTISRQRRFVTPQGESKADWWAICEVAKALGFKQGFNFTNSHQIFTEHAMLTDKVVSHFPNKQFTLAGLSHISEQEYDQFGPMQWPITKKSEQLSCLQINTLSKDKPQELLNIPLKQKTLQPSQYLPQKRLYQDGRFSTNNGLANFIATPLLTQEVDKKSVSNGIWLNSGRSRDQWHTMTRTGHIASLSASDYQPEVLLNPFTLDKLQMASGDLVKLTGVNSNENMFARAVADEAMLPGSAFCSMHWSTQFSHSGGVNQLLESYVDPWSLQPGFKHQRVQIEAYPVAVQGIIWGTSVVDFRQLIWCVKQTINDGVCHHFAAVKAELVSKAFSDAVGLSNIPAQTLEWQFSGYTITCLLKQGSVIGLCISDSREVKVDVNAVQALLNQRVDNEWLSKLSRLIKAGGSPLICACNGVTQAAISANMLETIQTLGTEQLEVTQLVNNAKQTLGCSAACGSCLNQVTDLARVALKSAELATQEVA